MKEKVMLAAKAEAIRFLAAVEAVERHGHYQTFDGRKADAYYTSPKHTGSLKRASMDLTRALADLRRPTW
jgi:hypothetical protein